MDSTGNTPPQQPALHIFCDFDGTISTLDIGDTIFDRFGQREPWHTQLMAGQLPIREYWLTMARELREPITMTALDELLASIPIDPGIRDLLALATERGMAFTVVSDGFDLYIRRYFELHGIGGIEVYSNEAEISGGGGLAMRFPHAREGCDCFSAACKRDAILKSLAPDERVIYIGDGASDFCPAEHADVIFAKGRLTAYCNEHRLPHYPFRTLSEVTKQLRLLLGRKRIRPRHQAAVKRRKAYEEE